MKKLSFILCAVALVFIACENKKRAVENPILSFEYREVEDTVVKGLQKFEIRSTSTPSSIAPDLWYYFGQNTAILIGDGWRCMPDGKHRVQVCYKPGVEPDRDAIHKSEEFYITLTGANDSIWKVADPVIE